MKKRLIFIFVLVLACAALLVACGDTTTQTVAAHAPEATAVPTPSPTPYVEQTFYETEEDVIVNGDSVKSYLAGDNLDTIYLPLTDAVKALDTTLDSYEFKNGNTVRRDFSFTYNDHQYVFYPDSTTCTVDGEEVTYTDKTIAYNTQHSLYVGMQSFCDVVGYKVIYDESNETYYCAENKNFTVTPGVQVPVLCFYGVGENSTVKYTYELFEDEDVFASMLDKLLDNGYEPIFFDDLDHLEDYTKPILLMFCTNVSYIYSYAFPVIKAYMVKVNLFVYPDEVNTSESLTMNQLKEMYKSEYVSLQAGGVVRDEAIYYGVEVSDRRQQLDVQEAYLDVLRASGQLPVAYCYNNGFLNNDVAFDQDTAWGYAKNYFSLAVVPDDSTEVYVTGTDDTSIPVMQVTRSISADSLIPRLEAMTSGTDYSSVLGYTIVYDEDGNYTVVGNG